MVVTNLSAPERSIKLPYSRNHSAERSRAIFPPMFPRARI